MTHLNGVLFQRDKWWVAQCLEFDIGAQAFTVADALYELDKAIVGHIAASLKHDKEPFSQLPKAPKAYWEMWEKAETVVKKIEQKSAFEVDHTPIPQTEFKLAA